MFYNFASLLERFSFCVDSFRLSSICLADDPFYSEYFVACSLHGSEAGVDFVEIQTSVLSNIILQYSM